nr:SEC14-like protein 2 [Parasteatoda tepidariorum]
MTVTEILGPDVEIKIQEFKKRFTKEMELSMYEDKFMFYRFLKARDFNMDQAESMLRKHLEWRKEFKIDKIMTEPFKLDVSIFTTYHECNYYIAILRFPKFNRCNLANGNGLVCSNL